jgi:rhodanese-related sulfurtransferase
MNSIKHRAFKDALFEQQARVTKAMASPHRLEILDLLAQSERSVEEIASLCGLSVANTSLHLRSLRSALLVKVRRAGLYAYYSLADDSVFRAYQTIRDLGERRYAEIGRLVDDYLSERHQFETVGADELLRRLRDGDVVVLDVRPREEFEAGHIRGAASIPIQELKRRLSEVPKRREIVAYCRGPFCVYADEAVSLLRRRGYRARRLDVGYPDWKTAGLPVSAKEESAP